MNGATLYDAGGVALAAAALPEKAEKFGMFQLKS